MLHFGIVPFEGYPFWVGLKGNQKDNYHSDPVEPNQESLEQPGSAQGG